MNQNQQTYAPLRAPRFVFTPAPSHSSQNPDWIFPQQNGILLESDPTSFLLVQRIDSFYEIFLIQENTETNYYDFHP